MNKTNNPFTTRLIRILMLAALILILRRVPGRFLFALLEGSGMLLIAGALLFTWHRFSKRLREWRARK